MNEKEQEQFQTQEDFFQTYPEYMTQGQMIQEIKDLTEKVKENQSLRKRIQEQDDWIKKLETGEVRTESIARLEKELHQQKFNNKHNLSIDGEVSKKIEELEKEVQELKEYKWKYESLSK